jgi:Fis family transcriptional regulator, factor for inversion stimulation protein
VKGIAYMMNNPEVLSVTTEKPTPKGIFLRDAVQQALQQYFSQLDGYDPAELYEMVLEEVEKPLLQIVLQRTRGNQSRAAKILGLSRGTLRKKMKKYLID